MVRRSFLAAAILATVVGSSVVVTGDSPDASVAVVSAAPAHAPRHPEKDAANKNHNGNGNGNGNNNRNGNGNNNGNGNGNDNGNDVDNGDDKPHDDRRERGGQAPSPQAPPASVAGRCFAVGQSGALSLSLDGGTVTLNVVGASSFPRDSRVTLLRVDPSALPSTPGARLDEIVFELRAQDGCDGNALGELPADANLGVSYRVTADKSALRFAVLDGGRWVDVPTTPDPNPSNPYVSATVRRTGIYVLYQAR